MGGFSHPEQWEIMSYLWLLRLTFTSRGILLNVFALFSACFDKEESAESMWNSRKKKVIMINIEKDNSLHVNVLLSRFDNSFLIQIVSLLLPS